MINVSSKGCRVRSAVPVQKGRYLRMQIDLVGETVSADLALVRWSSKEEWGIELIRMAPDQQARLDRFTHPPADDISAPTVE